MNCCAGGCAVAVGAAAGGAAAVAVGANRFLSVAVGGSVANDRFFLADLGGGGIGRSATGDTERTGLLFFGAIVGVDTTVAAGGAAAAVGANVAAPNDAPNPNGEALGAAAATGAGATGVTIAGVTFLAGSAAPKLNPANAAVGAAAVVEEGAAVEVGPNEKGAAAEEVEVAAAAEVEPAVGAANENPPVDPNPPVGAVEVGAAVGCANENPPVDPNPPVLGAAAVAVTAGLSIVNELGAALNEKPANAFSTGFAALAGGMSGVGAIVFPASGAVDRIGVEMAGSAAWLLATSSSDESLAVGASELAGD